MSNYRNNENLLEAWNELGPNAVDLTTGKRLFPNGKSSFSDLNRLRRASAAKVLDQISEGAIVTFPYDNVQYTAKVDSINQTTATVTITKIDGRPRSRKRTVGTKVRVSASILARS
jgi:hypothetical protein